MGDSEKTAYLVCRSGVVAGIVYQLSASLTTVGRDSQCGIALTREAAVVSGRHAEIFAVDKGWAVRDLDSTNGTFLNGRRVQESNLAPGDLLQFGASGPEFEFRLEVRPTAAQFDRTLVDKPSPESKPKPGKEEMLAEAVRKARAARGSGAHGQTMTIMREVLGTAVKKSSQRLRWTVAILLIALVGVGGFSMWRIQDLKAEKNSIEDRILEIEEELESGNLNEAEIKALVDELDNYQRQALELQDSVFYRFGVEGREAAFIEREILVLMKDFGAEGYAIPPEFVSQVGRFVERLQTRDRAIVEGVLGANREKFSTMREIFSSHKLPPDLAYMVLVESAFITQSKSSKGAVGLWQFTPATARAYGLTVNAEVDDRHDLTKSTHAAAKYVRELILEFGAGSSVMLALAAYNYGPRRVKRAVKRVEDPINQRNFWYLYEKRALPIETRQYVPKIIAAIIVGRNPERFGF